jgi:hypothetical protein
VARQDGRLAARCLACAAIAGLLAAGRSPTAAPLATLSEDVDGDGAPDAIELGRGRVVHIAAAAR